MAHNKNKSKKSNGGGSDRRHVDAKHLTSKQAAEVQRHFEIRATGFGHASMPADYAIVVLAVQSAEQPTSEAAIARVALIAENIHQALCNTSGNDVSSWCPVAFFPEKVVRLDLHGVAQESHVATGSVSLKVSGRLELLSTRLQLCTAVVGVSVADIRWQLTEENMKRLLDRGWLSGFSDASNRATAMSHDLLDPISAQTIRAKCVAVNERDATIFPTDVNQHGQKWSIENAGLQQLPSVVPMTIVYTVTVEARFLWEGTTTWEAISPGVKGQKW